MIPPYGNSPVFPPAADLKCAHCPETRSPRWYKLPQEPHAKICNACYRQIRELGCLADQAGVEACRAPKPDANCAIVACRVRNYPRWYKHPMRPDDIICETCLRQGLLEKIRAHR